MPEDVIEKIKKNLLPYISFCDLVGCGDPLISESLFKILDYCSRLNVKTATTTNGLMLNETNAKRLVKSNLSVLHISIDAVKDRTYREIRVGSNFDRVIENIKCLNHYKKQYKKENPVLSLEFVAMKKNIEELPEFIHLAKSLDAQSVNVMYLAVSDEKLREESLYYYQESSNENFKKAKNLARALGIELTLPGLFNDNNGNGSKRKEQSKRFECHYPWTFTFICQNGDVIPCCQMKAMGNLMKKSFREIWNGKGYRELREGVNSSEPPETCSRCAHPSLQDVNNIKTHILI